MDHLEAIRGESELFYSTADSADPALGVPSCPGWDIADLVWHLGEVQWFWATVIETRATDPEQVEKAKPARPRGYRELIAWGRAQAALMVRVLESTPDDVAVWTWALHEVDHNVAFIRRHQVQEAAVHRWDMQGAASASRPDPIAPDVAADSIDEFLVVSVPWEVSADKPLPGSVHIHCTDTDGEWFLEANGTVERVHEKGNVALRGPAGDLLLALYKRVPLDVLDVVGDASLARLLVERLNTE